MASLHDTLTKKWKGELLSREHAPGIYTAIDDMAAKAGIKSPEVYLVDSVVPFANLGIYNAASVSKDKIIITRPLLKILNSENLQEAPVASLRAIIGHEMSHCKFRSSEVPKILLPPLLLPLAATAGVYLYDKVKHAHDDTSQEKQQALNIAAADLQQKVEDSPTNPALGDQEKQAKKTSVHYGKYIAAAGLGLATGIMASRHFSNMHEFRADKLGAEWSGEAEALFKGLETVEKHTEDYVKEHGMGSINPLKLFIPIVLMKHPSNLERAAALGL